MAASTALIGQLKEFDFKAADWCIFSARLDNYFVANDITDDLKKRAIFLNILSEESYKLMHDLCSPALPESVSFTALINTFNEQFKPIKSHFAARHSFYYAQKEATESVVEWMARVRSLATLCAFNAAELSVAIRDVFVIGLGSGPIRDRLFEEDATVLSASDAVRIAQTKESARASRNAQVTLEPKQESVYKLGLRTKASTSLPANQGLPSSSRGAQNDTTRERCYCCGRKNHRAAQCNFKEATCYKCNKKGHLANVCKQGSGKVTKSTPVAKEVIDARAINSNFYRWVSAYRTYGHLCATINPVALTDHSDGCIDELNHIRYGLLDEDQLDYRWILHTGNVAGPVQEAAALLKRAYCSNVSAEFSYIENEIEREWLAYKMEQLPMQKLQRSTLREISELLIQSQAWDNFLANKFGSVKRYGGEGAESLLVFYKELFEASANDGIECIVLGAAHRGKLNLLTGLLQCPPVKIFRKFKGYPEFPSSAKAMCDIASHFNASADLTINGKSLHVSMLNNPSHLEAVNPVSIGKTRSKQEILKDGYFSDNPKSRWGDTVLNVQTHGDAAFAGQGINQECLMMSGTPHFEVGGTIHLIVNNQVGFTTPGDRGRSTRYCSDLAKSIDCPVFHVNGDDPEAVALVTRMAFDYQRKFRKDVFLDLNCFRRWGHNELDDPTFTNPALYKIIHERKSVPDMFADKLVGEGVLKHDEVESIAKNYTIQLNGNLKQIENYNPEDSFFKNQWTGIQQASNSVSQWDTGLDTNLLCYIGNKSVQYPSDFHIHPTLLKNHIRSRSNKIAQGLPLDWATAEALAMGSLMYQGHGVRLSGQDVGRGTFSHRHAVFVDQETNDTFIPLNNMDGGLGGKLEVANSILSEEAVLGFEYGMAIDNPHKLIIWEAQFGDFFNGAQIIIDTFISSGETKWLCCNGLVMLLPHGYDGAASEHSSCRMERFLQLTDSSEISADGDDINMHVANPTTPAQYYHLLRRQIVRNFRKPLVIVAPKTLLRLPEASSSLMEMSPGTVFQSVIDDANLFDTKNIKKVIFCSGKHYYALDAERKKSSNKQVAIVRLELLAPFPLDDIRSIIEKYRHANSFIWSQEEPRNMGAWTFIKPRFDNLVSVKLKYSGRQQAGTVAVGVSTWHTSEVQKIISEPFEMK